ncbi:unnamed protein product [Polarella glacialis]|uniref:Uncharacterized protein n=1 Tax=Polarella glacialis TaxID=89957 RepID=A0A813DTF4_POLGL|nr:unnamed protein product [Polarella glacialis]CAE8675678.1 unnamed protein product [Polarella glacialis]
MIQELPGNLSGVHASLNHRSFSIDWALSNFSLLLLLWGQFGPVWACSGQFRLWPPIWASSGHNKNTSIVALSHIFFHRNRERVSFLG